MELAHNILEDYCSAMSSDEPAILATLSAFTKAHHTGANMLSGAYQGRLLSMLSHLVRPNNVLEIGTYTGYSAICLAEGLADGGCVHSIEIDPNLKDTHDRFLGQAPYTDSIKVYYGDAKVLIPEMPETFELVFLDGAKKDYSLLFDLILDKMTIGGLLLADNVLWKGKVTDADNIEKNTEALRHFNQLVKSSTRVQAVLLPIRDGLFAIRKIA